MSRWRQVLAPVVREGICCVINQSHSIDNIEWPEYTSICFGLETALNDLQNGAKRIIYRSGWSQGLDEIPINGLIWMVTAGCLKCRVYGMYFAFSINREIWETDRSLDRVFPEMRFCLPVLLP